jgi:hypothetical protein
MMVPDAGFFNPGIFDLIDLYMKRNVLYLLLAIFSHSVFCSAQKQKGYTAIHSGIPWFDNLGRVVSAHGANIVHDDGRYYLFGEAHTDTSNAFAGFSCYSSSDVIEKDGLRINLFQDAALAKEHNPEFRLVTNNIDEVYNKVALSHPQFLHPTLRKSPSVHGVRENSR